MDAPHVAEGDVSAGIHDGDETLALDVDDPDPFEVGTPNDRMNALARTKPLLRKRHVNIPRHNSSLSQGPGGYGVTGSKKKSASSPS